MTYLLFPETGSWPSDGGVFNGNGDDREGGRVRGCEGGRARREEGGRGMREKSSDRRWERGYEALGHPELTLTPYQDPLYITMAT